MKCNNYKCSLRIIGPKGNWMVRNAEGASRNLHSGYVKRYFSTDVFIGPSVEGTVKEYVKVLSGKVDNKKPSFA